MNQKITVDASYFTFEEVYNLFKNEKDFRIALSEGKILVQGYKFTDYHQFQIDTSQISENIIKNGKEEDFAGDFTGIPAEDWKLLVINTDNFTASYTILSPNCGIGGFVNYSKMQIHKDELNKNLSYCPDLTIANIAFLEARKRNYKYREFIAILFDKFCDKYKIDVGAPYIWKHLANNWRCYPDYLMDYEKNSLPPVLVWRNTKDGSKMEKSTLTNIISKHRKGEILKNS
jgi:hypothetical protein